MNLFRTKPISVANSEEGTLRRCLTAFDLTLLGIGAIIGAGVFVLTGNFSLIYHCRPGLHICCAGLC
jgi:L-asparagine transporter-like permease